MARTIFRPQNPIGGRPQLSYTINYEEPCTYSFVNNQGQRVTLSGFMGTDGKCHYFSRRVSDKSAFDGERQVWSDMTGNRYC